MISWLNQDESRFLKIDWLPSYSELKDALETYGFLLNSPLEDSSDVEMVLGGNVNTMLPYISKNISFPKVFGNDEVEWLQIAKRKLGFQNEHDILFSWMSF